MIVPLMLLACALHELGHLSAIEWAGGTVKEINITLIGAEIRLDRSLGYWQEGIAALAGPGVNLLLALLFCQVDWGQTFSGLNLVLGCFNMLPVGQLDGGRALRCTLSLIAHADLAQRVSQCLDVIFVGMSLCCGLWLFGQFGNVTLLLVAVWMLRVCTGGKKTGNRACHSDWKKVK